ncbi:unnamed protein product [Adineta ricciae]|uniref:Reverse transcriptase domain-containing protein n=1 Tax=Adineta ricciae TaxID=249248 RepID=A0A815IK08_ADIRI|nr:unnamed protein product [Adineta ricciae]
MNIHNTDITTVLQQDATEEMVDLNQQQLTVKNKRKRHGNQKLHHFKRKYRSRGMTEEQITELINMRNDNNNQINNNNNTMASNNNDKVAKNKAKQRSNKRKRSERNNKEYDKMAKRSMSQLSISQQQPSSKRLKTNNNENNITTSTDHKPTVSSKYLQMPKKLLLHSLRLQLNHRIRKKKEKSFILSRLQLLDRQFCIDTDQYLYQSYFVDGSQHKIWPDDIIDMAQIDNYEHVEKFIKGYLIQLQEKFDQCTTQLINQALSCPKSIDLLLIENQLKEFVRLHHLDLTRKTYFQVNKFKDHIYEKELFQQLSSYPLTTGQCLEEYESTIEKYEFLYQEELINFESQLFDTEQNDLTINNNLMKCLYNYLHCQTMKKIREIRFNETIFRYKLLHPRHRRSSSSTTSNNTTNIYPEAIIEIFEKVFTTKELDLLSSLGGPSYIRLNQTSVQNRKKIQKQIQHQHSTIVDKLASDLYRRHGLPTKASILKKFSDQLETIFNQQFTMPPSVSYRDMYRTRQELKIILSIKRKLKKLPVIIRESDKSGIIHIGYKSDYDDEVLLYQEKTKAYKELSSNPLMDTFYRVIRSLNDLCTKQQIKVWQHKKMIPNQKTIQMAYLYFVPKPHKQGTPLRPIVSSMHTPTTGISKMLDQLIRPLFDQHVEKTTIIDGVHLIRRLELYVSLGLLKPTTHLCTCDITDLYTMLPQEESIAILKHFLQHFKYTHVQGMTIDAIETLARIVLMENVFYYEQKYYRQIKGGAMGSPFTLTLANIFMWHWEQKLVQEQRTSNELYGRYIDDIIFTSNDSADKVKQKLQDANNYHPNIKLTSTTDKTVSFLDVQIQNNVDNLITSVYHKEATEPYVVPFQSDHPRHVFVNIVECALLRAVRYSSTLDQFNTERRAIMLMLLYNGYPTRYIHGRFEKFFLKHSVTSTSITPMIHDENEFLLLHHHLLNQTTLNQHRRANRIAQTMDYNNFPPDIDPLVKEKLLKRRDRANSIIIRYLHEKRVAHYKKTIHQLWHDTFYNTPIQTTRFLVATRNNPNITKELIRRNPFTKNRHDRHQQSSTN